MKQDALARRVRELERELANTPVSEVSPNVFAKLEFTHPFSGSAKDRSVVAIIREAIDAEQIGPKTTVIESSSGNFAIAAALVCARLGLRFVPVLDSHVSPLTLRTLETLCEQVVVAPGDNSGDSYIKLRRRMVADLVNNIPDAWWPDQYRHTAPVRAHSHGTCKEILRDVADLDEIYVAVGTGGTLAGVLDRVERDGADTRVIAVDVEGSVIFGGAPGPRFIPGMGSGMTSQILEGRLQSIAQIVRVPETEIVASCRTLARDHGMFCGGSTGAVYAAIRRSIEEAGPEKKRAFIAVDRGTAYAATVYNDEWVQETYGAPNDV